MHWGAGRRLGCRGGRTTEGTSWASNRRETHSSSALFSVLPGRIRRRRGLARSGDHRRHQGWPEVAWSVLEQGRQRGIREREGKGEGRETKGERNILSSIFGFSKPVYIPCDFFQNEVSFLRILSRIFDILTITTKTCTSGPLFILTSLNFIKINPIILEINL